MSYGDGLMLLGQEKVTQVEVAAADIESYRLPFPCTVLGAAVHITEDFVAQTTDPVASVDFEDIDTARTELLSFTMGSSVALKRSDGSRVGQTAITADTDLDKGHMILFKGTALPKRLQPGAILTLEHKTAGVAGGAYSLVVLVRVEGYDLQNDAVWTL